MAGQRTRGYLLLLPFLLLVAYAVALGLHTLRHEGNARLLGVEESTAKKVTLRMARMQMALARNLKSGQLAAVRARISELGADPHVRVALLVDDQDLVLASTRLELIGKPLQEAWPELAQPPYTERAAHARTDWTGSVDVSPDGGQLVGSYPVFLNPDTTPPRVGLLFLQHDLLALKAASRQETQRTVVQATFLFLLLAAGIGVLFHVILGRRLQKLADDVRNQMGVAPSAQSELPRTDALGNLGLAIDELAAEIGRNRQRLEENEERFQTLIERSPDAILIHREGQLVFINPAGVSMLGYERAEELQGRPMEALLPSSDEEETLTGAPLEAASAAAEVEWQHRSGRKVLGEVVAFPLVFDGKPAVVSIVRDVTERKAVQTRLRAADRMVSLGTLAAGVAHEINNPLSFMLSNLRFIDDELRALMEEGQSLASERGREVREALQETLVGGNRVNDIVKDLKTFARSNEERYGQVNVHEVLDLCANIARSELRHRARLVKEYGTLPPVLANESRLGQVFLNLIVNAAQAIPEGGDVKANEVRLTTTQDAQGWAVVAVKDTGTGISPENLGRLFDPFFTTKPAGVGTGLGLSICHGIIVALGGRITVESELGKGSTFRVFLPPAGGGAVAALPEQTPVASEQKRPEAS
ncbi:PAS domain S-box-containing protein [Stigmatella aurantiaca]|uniref:histidine kinase n=1 Tax=Stigmatella aurantiaca TaxID=41 RepID=A0A1H8BQ22_STIAU|nr:ATP-binding protein [Stigmatella aurantiaca]SEM85001.1 PAS domain S-box-containing protein [Stigmatella aurantiaca]